MLLWNVSNSNLAKKSKNYFFRQKFQKSHLKLHRSDKFLGVNLFLGFIFDKNTETEKTYGFW